MKLIEHSRVTVLKHNAISKADNNVVNRFCVWRSCAVYREAIFIKSSGCLATTNGLA